LVKHNPDLKKMMTQVEEAVKPKIKDDKAPELKNEELNIFGNQ
jgi:hypothetical protein